MPSAIREPWAAPDRHCGGWTQNPREHRNYRHRHHPAKHASDAVPHHISPSPNIEPGRSAAAAVQGSRSQQVRSLPHRAPRTNYRTCIHWPATGTQFSLTACPLFVPWMTHGGMNCGVSIFGRMVMPQVNFTYRNARLAVRQAMNKATTEQGLTRPRRLPSRSCTDGSRSAQQPGRRLHRESESQSPDGPVGVQGAFLW